MNLCGDCRLLILNKIKCSDNYIDKYLSQYNNAISNKNIECFIDKLELVDNGIFHQYGENDKLNEYFIEININKNDIEENILIVHNIYEYAYNLLEKIEYFKSNNFINQVCNKENVAMKKRIANTKNELGTYYLSQCSNLIKYDEENLG